MTGTTSQAQTGTPAEFSPAGLAADGWREQVDHGFIRHVGPFWERPRDGGFQVAFLADDRHRNRSGVVQGGMLATLADRTLGATARMDEPDRPQSTVQLDVQYVDAGRIGDFIIGHGRLLRRTATLIFVAGELTAGGRLIAHMSGVWKIRRRSPAA